MSSSAGGVAVAVPHLYFCHQCNRNVSIAVRPNADLLCPSCHSEFVEEVEENPSHPSPNPSFDHFHNQLFSFLSEHHGGGGGASVTGVPFGDSFGPSIFRSRTRVGVAPQEAVPFNPLEYIQEYFTTARAGGTEFHIVINGQNAGEAGFQMPANLGDYFVGPGFEQLIQQLAENDPNRYGTPPAARSAVEALPDITVDENLLKSELAQCAVCFDDFEKGMVVKQMPCKHVYHPDCIIPWLELHNSCPVCRYELPTDDPDYQSVPVNPSAAGGSNAPGTSGGGGGGAGAGAQAALRRFNISLNWPFGRRGGDGSGDGSNDGDSSAGGQ